MSESLKRKRSGEEEEEEMEVEVEEEPDRKKQETESDNEDEGSKGSDNEDEDEDDDDDDDDDDYDEDEDEEDEDDEDKIHPDPVGEGLPMHSAASNGNVEELGNEKHREDIEKLDESGRLPLHVAAAFGQLEAIEWLCKNGDGSKRDAKGKSIAHYAAKYGGEKVLEWVKENQTESLTAKDEEGLMPVHDAGSAAALTWFETQGVDVATTVEGERNIAHLAAHSSATGVIRWVKENKPDLLQAFDAEGNLPFHVAANCSSRDVLDILIEDSQIDVKNRDGLNIGHTAALKGNLVLLQWIICKSWGRKMLWNPNDAGYTAEAAAAEGGHVNCLDYLTSLVDLQEKFRLPGIGMTLAHGAVLAADPSVPLDWTQTKKPEYLTKEDLNGMAPVHWAAEKGKIEALKWLANTANPKIDMSTKSKSGDGKTPLEYAEAAGQAEAVAWLKAN